VDLTTLRKILEHLVSQSQFSEILKAIATHQDAQVHLILADESSTIGIEQIALLVRAIAENSARSGIQKVIIPGDDTHASVGVHVMTLVMGAATPESDGTSAEEPPQTLREAIDREWPW